MMKYKQTISQSKRWFVFVLLIIGCTTGCGEDSDPHVGSRDCNVLDETPGVPQGLCSRCQAQACGSALTCDPESDSECALCALFPCVDEQRVVQGCTNDADCSEFEGFYCGAGTSSNKYLCGSDIGDL